MGPNNTFPLVEITSFVLKGGGKHYGAIHNYGPLLSDKTAKIFYLT